MKKVVLLITMVVFGGAGIFSFPYNFDYKGAKLVKKEGNKEVYKKPNGLVIEKYSDKEVAEMDGKYVIVRYPSGKRVIHIMGGTKITVKVDGSMICKYPNGKTKTVSMDGKTPYGIKIKKKLRGLKIKDLVVVVYYSPKLSDNNMTKYSQKLYDAVIAASYNWMKQNKKLERRVDIKISNCRFARTGYCKRKGKKEIEVISYIHGKKHKSYALSHEIIFKNKNIHVVAKKIVDSIM